MAYTNFLLVRQGHSALSKAKQYLEIAEEQDGTFKPVQILRLAIDGYEGTVNGKS